jgi:hypothetical protein
MLYRVVLICGSRGFRPEAFMRQALEVWTAKHGAPREVVEGCEPTGIDWLAGHIVVPDVWPDTVVQHFPADWNRYGRAAGPIRNQQMLDEGAPDAVIAFSVNLESSRGTADMVRRSRNAGLHVWLPIKQPEVS